MLRRRVVNRIALVLLATLAVAQLFLPVSWLAYAFILFAWFSISACGSFFIRWNYHLNALHANYNPDSATVAITFDDGPNPEFTPPVLALLKRYNAKATFFCIGEQMVRYPEVLKEIISAGHTVGNHTLSHSKMFGFFSYHAVLSELKKTNALMKEATGLDMKLYRPCFGVTNPNIERAVDTMALHTVGWSVRSLDTTFLSEPCVYKRVTSSLSKGDIILLHDTSKKSIAVLERLLLFLQGNNLTSVPVDELLNLEPYA